jgi:S1-C subfamily serine protease
MADELAKLPRWLGMALRGLTGEEFSAFGVSREEGGVQLLQLRRNSPAVNAGFQADDLVQKINGQKVRTAEELLAEVGKAGSDPIRVQIIRNQQPMEIILKEGE